MDDLYRAFDDRAQVILQRLDAKRWDLLVGVIESTDRVQHMMWRLIDPQHPMYDKALAAKFGDSIERVYRKRGRLRRRGDDARRPDDADHDRLRPRVPFVAQVREPEHLARAGRASWRSRASSRARRSCRTCSAAARSGKTSTGRRTRAYAMGLGQIYFNLQRPRSPRHRRPGADSKQLAERARGRLLTYDRSRRRRADGRRGLQTRRHLHGTVPAERVRAAGRLGRRLSRVLAVDARRIAAGHRLSEHEEVVGRSRSVRLQADIRHAHLEPAARRGPARHHRHRAHGAEVFRRCRYRRISMASRSFEEKSAETAETAENLAIFSAVFASLRFFVSFRTDAANGRGPRRSRGAPPSGFRRCSARRTAWRPRSAPCSAICESSRSNGKSRRRS